MKKLEDDIDSPIDNLIIHAICEPLSTFLRGNTKITPNIITCIGIVFGIISMVCIYTNNFITAFIFFWLYYLTDCLDGHFARKYDMVTEFGDQLDHYRDLFVNVGVCIAIFFKLNNVKHRVFFVSIVSLFTVLSSMFLGCQERLYNVHGNVDFLSYVKYLCTDENNVNYLRYFGVGTNILIISLFILSLMVVNK